MNWIYSHTHSECQKFHKTVEWILHLINYALCYFTISIISAKQKDVRTFSVTNGIKIFYKNYTQ